MLTVGVDSYVTVLEADEYISKSYTTTDARVTQWASLSENDKEVFLKNACDEMNNIVWRGVVFKAFQPLAFPRFFGDGWAMSYYDLIAPETYVYPELNEVPSVIKFAQIEEAFELACPSDDTAKFEEKNGSVQSYTIGHLSETYKVSPTGSVESVLKSSKAQKLAKGYTGGAYEIE